MTVEEAGVKPRVREGRPPTRRPSEFIEVELMRALSDELRVRVWAYLCEHTAGAPEIAKAIGESQNSVRFHVGELVAGEWVEPVASSGRTQKYRARRQALLTPGIWDRLPEDLRQHVGVRLLRIFYADAKRSMEAGSFFRPGVHLSLTPMVVDAQGKGDAKALMEECVEGLIAIQAESNERTQESGQSDAHGVSLTVALAAFEALRSPADGLKASQTVQL